MDSFEDYYINAVAFRNLEREKQLIKIKKLDRCPFCNSESKEVNWVQIKAPMDTLKIKTEFECGTKSYLDYYPQYYKTGQYHDENFSRSENCIINDEIKMYEWI